MITEEKQLLLKDLCGRLPYGVRVCYKIHLKDKSIDVTLSGLLLDYFKNKTIVEIKPYLRPLLSMTESEKFDYTYKKSNHTEWEAQDYLNKHHLDYRGLIEKGLALKAPENMYNTKQ